MILVQSGGGGTAGDLVSRSDSSAMLSRFQVINYLVSPKHQPE
jgi:hypothetical protein